MNPKYRNKNWLYNQYWNKEKSAQQIANENKVSRGTIDYWLNKFKIKKRTQKKALASYFKDKLFRNRNWLYQQYIIEEKSIRDIAKEFSLGYNSIWEWLYIHKIPIRNYSEAQLVGIKQGKNIFHKGHGFTKEMLEKISIANSGVNNGMYGKNDDLNPNWKGENAGKKPLHKYLRKHNKCPKECEICNEKKDLELSFDHSKGKYTRNIEDYKWLCKKCHTKRDKESELKTNLTNLTITGLHYYIKRYKKKPNYCIICNEEKKLLLACIDHYYTKNSNDYIWLCYSCHAIFDQCRNFMPNNIKMKNHKRELILNYV